MDGVSAESARLPGPQSLARFLVRGIASLRARKGYAAIMRVPPNAGEQRDDDCPGSDRNAGNAVGRCREGAVAVRSEEHTSELQSLMRISYAVFCLKKKKKTTSTATARTDQSNTRNKNHTRT